METVLTWRRFLLRGVAPSVGAALLAPLIVVAFGADWHGALAVRTFASALVYAACIGVPGSTLLPLLGRRVGKRGRRLTLAMAVGILVLAVAGTLVGAVVLRAVGLGETRHFWREYWFSLRITCTLGLAGGMAAFFYESLASQLRESRATLQQKELEEERVRKLAAEARLSSLEARLHPHFLFNTLNSISALIPVDPLRAEQIVGQLAALLRSSLDTTRQPAIPLEAELGMVRNYLDIEQARFGERLRYAIDAPEDAAAMTVPPLAVQSLVENAVKHGVSSRFGGGDVLVIARRDEAGLRVEVRDSGPGFDLTAVEAGRGLDNLVSRLDVLYGPAAGLEVARREGWCVVTLRLPAAAEAEACR